MMEFEIKSFPDFWDWLDKLPENSSHPRGVARKDKFAIFIKDSRYNSYYKEGVYIFCSAKNIPVICLARIQVPQASCRETPDDLWLTFVSVDPAFRRQGLGLALVRRCFQYAADNKKILQLSSHEADGAAYLLPHYSRLLEETGVRIRFADFDLRYRSERIPPAYRVNARRLTL